MTGSSRASERTSLSPDGLALFEKVARRSARYTDSSRPRIAEHPFETWNLHPALPAKVRTLFDNAHYDDATFNACKFLEQKVRRIAGSKRIGEALMMEAFNEVTPAIRLNQLSSDSERDEHRGYKFLFAGLQVGVRNPRGHEVTVRDEVNTCLEHLSMISHLLRRLELAGYSIT